MHMARKRLGEILVQAGVIDEVQLKAALGEQRKWGRPLGQTLVEMRFIDESTLVRLLSTQLNIPAVVLEKVKPAPIALGKLDYEFCATHLCFPFAFDEKGLFLDVAMSDPTNPEVFDRIRVRTRCNVRPHLAGHRAVENAIRKAYLGHEAPQDNRPWLARPDEVIFDPTAPDDAPPPRRPSSPAAPTVTPTPPAAPPAPQKELGELQQSVQQLWAHVLRDEQVLRKLMSLLVERGLCSREELMTRLNED